MQYKKWKLLLFILTPVLIGLIAGEVLVLLPSVYFDLLYWLTPVLMIVLWPLIGSRFASMEAFSPWKAILMGNSMVLLCMAASVVIMLLPFSNSVTQAILNVSQAYAMPMIPLVSALWLFYDGTNLDAYASIIMAIVSGLLLVGMFAAGYGYRRLNMTPESKA